MIKIICPFQLSVRESSGKRFVESKPLEDIKETQGARMAQRLERSPLTAVARVRFAGIHFPLVERPLLNSHNRL